MNASGAKSKGKKPAKKNPVAAAARSYQQGLIAGANAQRRAARGMAAVPTGPLTQQHATAADAFLGSIRAAGAGSKSGSFNRLAMSMCLPSVSANVRAAVGIANRPTAVSKPFEKNAISIIQTAAAAGAGGNNDAMFMCAFRQFTRANVTQQYVPAGSWAQDLQSAKFDNSFGNEEGWVPIHHATAVTPGTVPTHGPVQFAMRAPDGVPCLWIDSPTGASYVQITGLPAAVAMTFRRYNGDNTTDVTQTSAGGGLDTYIFTAGSGYYAIGLQYNGGGNDGSALTFEVTSTFVGASYSYAHTVLPGLLTNAASFTSGRISAVSLMLSNYSAELSKRGRITGWVAPDSADWTQYATTAVNGAILNAVANPWGRVSGLADATDLEAKDGMYGFLLPTDNEAMNMKPMCDVPVGAYADVATTFALEPLLPEDGFLVIVLDAAAATAATTLDDRVFVRTSFYHFEGLTGDPWRATDFPNMAPSHYLDDLCLLRKVKVFHSNKWHFSEIARKISNVAGWAAPFLGALGSIPGPTSAPLLALGTAAGAINGLGNAFLPEEAPRRPRRRV